MAKGTAILRALVSGGNVVASRKFRLRFKSFDPLSQSGIVLSSAWACEFPSDRLDEAFDAEFCVVVE
jgi:hypothetical protein